MTDLQETLQRVYSSSSPGLSDLEKLLSLESEEDLKVLFSFADNVRKKHLGDGILLRGIVEFSNYCRNTCFYCGLNKNNTKLTRYRLSKEELLESVAHISSCGVKTVVLQAGEEDDLDPSWLAEAVKAIKSRFDMAITLSVGERSGEDYRLWKNAGADRYLLKIETSDKDLYGSLHPGMSFEHRLNCLDELRELGYQVGSGNIIGLRKQTPAIIAKDILFFAGRDLDMIGIGPFIPHQDTELRSEKPGTVAMTLKTVALTRIVTKNSHLPATTALGSIDGKDLRIDGLKCGANVLMPNFTPQPYRKLYEIYPGKRCVEEPQGACAFCMEGMAESIGRHIDYSKGNSLKTENRE